jgi:putative DNA primase/helicase
MAADPSPREVPIAHFAQPRASLAALAAVLGGECYSGGRRALVPAPGHSAGDRSVSLLLVDGRLLVHSFGEADWRAVLDDLRGRGWIDSASRLLDGGGRVAPAAPDPTRSERIAAARRLWAAAGPVGRDGPAALYCARRGVDLALDRLGALRASSATAASVYRDRGPRRPALLAAVRDVDGALSAVEITYLDACGRRSTLARPSRKIVGVLPPGHAVRLTTAAPEMLVGEGVFTTLSAMRRFRLPGWALLSTSNLRRWRPPQGVRRVLIAADRGRDGEASAERLRAGLVRHGVGADVRLPPAPFGDWNDWEMHLRASEAAGRTEQGTGRARPGAG